MLHIFKVGTHEGTSRRDLFQGLVRCSVYTMGQVPSFRGDKSLEGFTRGDLLHIEIAKFKGDFTEIQGKRRDEKGAVLNSETEVAKF